MFELRSLIYRLVILKTVKKLRVVKSKDGYTVRKYIMVRPIFAKRYGRLVRYAFFVMVRVRYVGMVRFKN